MKTKIMTVLLTGILFMSFLAAGVFAEDQAGEQANLESSSNVANSVFLSNVKLFFTTNEEKKANISLKIANKHSLKAKEALEEGNAEKAKKQMQKANKKVERARENMNKMEIANGEEKSQEALDAFNRSQKRIQEHQEFVEQIHADVLENMSEKMTEDQLANVEEAFNQHRNGVQNALNAMEQRRENLQSQFKAKFGLGNNESSGMHGVVQEMTGNGTSGQGNNPLSE